MKDIRTIFVMTFKVRILQFLTTQLNSSAIFFICVLFAFEHNGWSCKMWESVKQKCGHTKLHASCIETCRIYLDSRTSQHLLTRTDVWSWVEGNEEKHGHLFIFFFLCLFRCICRRLKTKYKIQNFLVLKDKPEELQH